MDVKNCKFCSKKSSYTCPKCSSPYCSSKCYRSSQHLHCSEEFFKGHVENDLKEATANPESKAEMFDVLQRIQEMEANFNDQEEIEEMDSDDEEEIAERFKDIDINDSDVVWSRLTPGERSDFLSTVREGRTTDIIPEWRPWWMPGAPVAPVEEIAKEDSLPPFMKHCPELLQRPPLSQILKCAPSKCVPFNIANVLAAYAWTCRLFNGEHLESCCDATEAVLTLSPVLSMAANYEDAAVAIDTPKVIAQDHTWLRQDDSFLSSVSRDVVLLTGPQQKAFRGLYAAAALSDLHTLLSGAMKNILATKKSGSSVFLQSSGLTDQEITKKLSKPEVIKKSIKKIEFLLSYLKEYKLNIHN